MTKIVKVHRAVFLSLSVAVYENTYDPTVKLAGEFHGGRVVIRLVTAVKKQKLECSLPVNLQPKL